jgi:hypothetical protein
MDTRSVELDKKKQNIGTLYIKRRLRPQATCRVDTVEEAHFYAPQLRQQLHQHRAFKQKKKF